MKKLSILLIIILFAGMALIPSASALLHTDGTYMKFVTEWPVNTYHNYVYKGTLYSGEGYMTRIYNVTSGRDFSTLTADTYDNQLYKAANDYTADAGKLYIIGGNTLDIYDVSTPYKQLFPVLLGSYAKGGTRVVVNGNYAYVAGGSVITCLDISNPASPVLISTTTTSQPRVQQIVFDGRYAYTGFYLPADANTAYFTIWDYQDPHNPIVVNTSKFTTTLAGIKNMMAYRNNTLYFASYSTSFQSWDVTNRSAPVRIDVKFYQAVGARIVDHYVYVTIRYNDNWPFGGGGVAIWNVTNQIPEGHGGTSRFWGYIGTGMSGGDPFFGYTEDVGTDGKFLSVSGNTNGENIFNVTDPWHPVFLKRLNIMPTAYGIGATTIGNIDVLAFSGRNMGMWFMNITDPSAPNFEFNKPLTVWTPPKTPRQYNVEFDGNYTFGMLGTNGNGAYIVNLTGIGTHGFSPGYREVSLGDPAKIVRTYFMIGNETRSWADVFNGVLSLYDITNKETTSPPALMTHQISPTADWSNLMFYNNTVNNTHYLMAVNGYGIQLFDVTQDNLTKKVYDGKDAHVPVQMYPYYDPIGQHMYFYTSGKSDSDKYMHSVDISDINNFHNESGTIEFNMVAGALHSTTGNGTDVYQVGRNVGHGDIMMFDFSDPNNVKLVDTAATGGGSNEIAVFYKGYLYVGNENAISIWKVAPSSEKPQNSPDTPMIGLQDQRAEQQSNSSVVDQIINQVSGLLKKLVNHFTL